MDPWAWIQELCMPFGGSNLRRGGTVLGFYGLYIPGLAAWLRGQPDTQPKLLHVEPDVDAIYALPCKPKTRFSF